VARNVSQLSAFFLRGRNPRQERGQSRQRPCGVTPAWPLFLAAEQYRPITGDENASCEAQELGVPQTDDYANRRPIFAQTEPKRILTPQMLQIEDLAMRNPVEIDYWHSRAITEEIGDRLRLVLIEGLQHDQDIA
jgi:hypothetical protein